MESRHDLNYFPLALLATFLPYMVSPIKLLGGHYRPSILIFTYSSTFSINQKHELNLPPVLAGAKGAGDR